MSIFRREAENPPAPRATPGQPTPQRPAASVTTIAPGSRFQGEISGKTDLVIDGEFEGTVQLSSQVTVGPRGAVRGEISAQTVRILGRMQGNVQGTDLVELAASGTLEGNVAAVRVIIAEGAFFKGSVEMSGQRDGAAASKPASDSAPKGSSGEAGKSSSGTPNDRRSDAGRRQRGSQKGKA